MGVVRVSADVGLEAPVLIDGCADASEVAEGQGHYVAVRVPAVGAMAPPPRLLNFTLVARAPGDRVACAAPGGSNFSLAGVVGLVAGGRRARARWS